MSKCTALPLHLPLGGLLHLSARVFANQEDDESERRYWWTVGKQHLTEDLRRDEDGGNYNSETLMKPLPDWQDRLWTHKVLRCVTDNAGPQLSWAFCSLPFAWR